MIRWENSGISALSKETCVGREGRGGRLEAGEGQVGQTHKAPEEGEEPSKDEVYDEGQVNWAL